MFGNGFPCVVEVENLCDQREVQEVASLLEKGRVVILPTETVYGLAAQAFCEEAVQQIFFLKKRPTSLPLIVHCSGRDQIKEDVVWSAVAHTLSHHFWPGPLTLIMNRSVSCRFSPAVSGGGPTLAARAPAHPFFQAVVSLCGAPLVATSVNPSGGMSITDPRQIHALFPGVPVWEDGRSLYGIESTIIDCTGDQPTILRRGAIPQEVIEDVLGCEIFCQEPPSRPRGLGKPLRLDVSSVFPDEGLLAFGPPLPGAHMTFSLSDSGCLLEAARNLFIGLHALNSSACRAIAVMPLPDELLGRTLRSRLEAFSQA